MRWLPEYGVGMIAFGNRTYTGWGETLTAAFDLLAKTGGLQPREVQPSPALMSAQKSVTQLVSAWDDRLAESIAAENLFLDESRDRRRARVDELRSKVGACPAAPEKFAHVENALRGQWTIACERGKLLATITLAPTMPPKVQFLNVQFAPASVGPPQPCSQ